MQIAQNNEEGELQEMALSQTISMHAAARPLEVSIYDNEIPDFVEYELERLYECVYSTVARFRIYGEADGASTYIGRSGNAIVSAILFRVTGHVVQVLNQQVVLSDHELRCFADAVFAKYRSAWAISFYAIEADIGEFPRPFQQWEALEENVLKLPESAEKYMASLSQNLLKRIQSAERKLKRDHPAFEFNVLKHGEISEAVLRRIVDLAGARMASKQKDSYISDEDIGKMLALLHKYGYLGVMTIDGEIRAGNIFYGVGDRYFMHVIAHDPDYDKYMLGHMVQYLAACHCIHLGGRECCLMGGGRENKARFRAYPKYLNSVDIYRSRFHYLLSWRRLSAGAARRFMHWVRHDAAQLAHGEGRTARVAAKCIALARSAKQAIHGSGVEK